MSRVCDLCGKGPITGNRVSHATNRRKRRWLPNLQKVKIVKEGKRKQLWVCTQCIRKGIPFSFSS